MYLYETRYSVEMKSIPAGNWVLLEGIDKSILKTATIIDAKE